MSLKHFSYKEFNVTLDKRGCGVSVFSKKLSNSPRILNGFKIWKPEGETLYQFITRIKQGIEEIGKPL